VNKIKQAVVAACADTMFPPAGPIPISGTEAGLVEYVEKYQVALSPSRRVLMDMMFSFIQMSPCLFGPRRSLFTRLSPADRLRVFEGMAKSPVYFRRVVFLSMRAIMTMGYFACPRVNAVIMGKRTGKESP
jgi:hypothetical protein